MMSSTSLNRLSLTIIVLTILVISTPVSDVTSTDHTVSSEANGLSIILLIGDGMGFEHVKLGRWVEVGTDGNLTMDMLPYNWSVTTHSADAAITDSAASATAIATGVKTNNHMVGQSPSGSDLTTILEIAETMGKSTGLISTTSYYHATPAGFYANVSSRYDYADITQQLVDDKDVDVVLSGGLSQLTAGQLTIMQSRGYTLVENRAELDAVSSGKVLGMFDISYMPDELTRDLDTTPSIAEMTNKSLEILSQDADGFFLMVEGGQIDWSGHDNDKVGVALETIAFDKAINISLQYVQEHSNSILLITADHETGGLTVVSNTLAQEMPSDSNTEADNRNLRVERANNVTTTWTGTSHTATPVPLFMYGDALSAFPDVYDIDNTDIFVIMDTYFAG
ncbi:MAG: alkaline phosphatase, partial [Candidatus Thorarchaeota archaeon]